MKETLISLGAILAAYFGAVWIPLVVLLLCMVLDYATGIVRAWYAKELCSRVGIVGIVKKACYLAVVAVSMICDWVISSGVLGISISFFMGSLVIVWLIVNELISILENLIDMEIPLPPFILAFVERLRKNAEKKGEEHGKDESI